VKHLVRGFLFNVFGLWLVTQWLPTVTSIGSWQMITIAGLVLSLLMFIVKPMLKILFIPINLITFGLLSWFVDVLVLFLLTVLTPQVDIHAGILPQVSLQGFTIPPIQLTYFYALVLTSVVFTVITNILHSVSED
jgi:putative membrane protein